MFCNPTLKNSVAIKPLLSDMLSFLFTIEHDVGLSVPRRLVLRRCAMSDTLGYRGLEVNMFNSLRCLQY